MSYERAMDEEINELRAENSNLREALRLALGVVGELPHAEDCRYTHTRVNKKTGNQHERVGPCNCQKSPDSPCMKRIKELMELPAAADSHQHCGQSEVKA